MVDQLIKIHRDAPDKPATGSGCNGCGVCCAVEPCPVSKFWLRQKMAPCRALVWSDAERRYRCGLMQMPAQYILWLPVFLNGIFARLVAGWLAADEGCDSDSELIDSRRS